MLSICNPNFQIQLHGQIDWKIKNFLDWAQLKETGYKEFSSVFNFDFPEVKKSYSFSLRLDPKGEPDKEETKDQVGIFINNINSETLGIITHGAGPRLPYHYGCSLSVLQMSPICTCAPILGGELRGRCWFLCGSNSAAGEMPPVATDLR